MPLKIRFAASTSNLDWKKFLPNDSLHCLLVDRLQAEAMADIGMFVYDIEIRKNPDNGKPQPFNLGRLTVRNAKVRQASKLAQELQTLMSTGPEIRLLTLHEIREAHDKRLRARQIAEELSALFEKP